MKNVTIHNATHRMVLVPCNSGRNLYIPPRGTSAELPESEVQPNARVEKLLGRKAIVVQPVSSAPKPSKPGAEGRAPGRKTETPSAEPPA